MKTIRKWLIFLIMARIQLRVAYAELIYVERGWELQYRPYSSIISYIRGFILGTIGALVCLVGLMGIALL